MMSGSLPSYEPAHASAAPSHVSSSYAFSYVPLASQPVTASYVPGGPTPQYAPGPTYQSMDNDCCNAKSVQDCCSILACCCVIDACLNSCRPRA